MPPKVVREKMCFKYDPAFKKKKKKKTNNKLNKSLDSTAFKIKSQKRNF